MVTLSSDDASGIYHDWWGKTGIRRGRGTILGPQYGISFYHIPWVDTK